MSLRSACAIKQAEKEPACRPRASLSWRHDSTRLYDRTGL